jgi:hypothetical protein
MEGIGRRPAWTEWYTPHLPQSHRWSLAGDIVVGFATMSLVRPGRPALSLAVRRFILVG